MRSAFATVFCALAVAVSGARADDDKELKKFHGVWTFESAEAAGQQLPAADFKDMTVTFAGDTYTVKKGDEMIQTGKLKLDPARSPKAIDVTVTDGLNKGSAMPGIYEIDGDTLKVCFDSEGKKRPTQFKSTADSQTFVNVHKRVKK